MQIDRKVTQLGLNYRTIGKINTYSDYDEYIWGRVSYIEYTRSTQSGNILPWHIVMQHFLACLRWHIKVKVLRDSLPFSQVIQRHRGKDRFNFQV